MQRSVLALLQLAQRRRAMAWAPVQQLVLLLPASGGMVLVSLLLFASARSVSASLLRRVLASVLALGWVLRQALGLGAGL